MAGMSDYLENKILDQIFNATAYAFPGTLYIALYTAVPTDAGGGTEVAGGAYARVAVTANVTNFPAAGGGTIDNNTAITFAVAAAPWGTVVAFGVFDALTGGNLLIWNLLIGSKTIALGDQVSFSIGQLVFNAD